MTKTNAHVLLLPPLVGVLALLGVIAGYAVNGITLIAAGYAVAAWSAR